jgi:hypothetical protein
MKTFLLLTFTLALAPLSQAHSNPIPITSLPVTITQPGSYYFIGDLTAAPGTYRATIEIEADNVTLDLEGHTMRTAPGAHVTIDIRGDHVVVRNGRIQVVQSGQGIFTNPGFERAILEHLALGGGGDCLVDSGTGTIVSYCTLGDTEGCPLIILNGTGLFVSNCHIASGRGGSISFRGPGSSESIFININNGPWPTGIP